MKKSVFSRSVSFVICGLMLSSQVLADSAGNGPSNSQLTQQLPCGIAYKRASKHRDIRNFAIVGAITAATGGTAVVLSTGTAASLFALGYYVEMLTAFSATGMKLGGHDNYDNRFDNILDSFHAARSGTTDKFLDRLIKKAAKEAGHEEDELSPELVAHALQELVNGFENETFCPLLRTKKNGKEVRAVFNRPALIKYLSEKL